MLHHGQQQEDDVGNRVADSRMTLHQHIGRLEGRVDGMETRQTQFEERVDTSLSGVNTKLDTLLEAYSDAAGAKRSRARTLSAVGSIILAVAGAVAWALNNYIDVSIDADEASATLEDVMLEDVMEELNNDDE